MPASLTRTSILLKVSLVCITTDSHCSSWETSCPKNGLKGLRLLLGAPLPLRIQPPLLTLLRSGCFHWMKGPLLLMTASCPDRILLPHRASLYAPPLLGSEHGGLPNRRRFPSRFSLSHPVLDCPLQLGQHLSPQREL